MRRPASKVLPKVFFRYQHFVKLMIGARKKAGLSQAALAARLGKPQSFVAKYEGGERRLDVIEFLLVAKEIGADPAKIIRELT
jgi:transcriptional regulator with XRE-family HTH domain